MTLALGTIISLGSLDPTLSQQRLGHFLDYSIVVYACRVCTLEHCTLSMARTITFVVSMSVVLMSTSSKLTGATRTSTQSDTPSLVPWPRSATFGADGDAVTLSSASRVVYSSPLLAQAAQGLVEDLHTIHGVRDALLSFCQKS